MKLITKVYQNVEYTEQYQNNTWFNKSIKSLVHDSSQENQLEIISKLTKLIEEQQRRLVDYKVNGCKNIIVMPKGSKLPW